MYKFLLVSTLAFILFSGCSSRVDTTLPQALDKKPMYVDKNTLVLFALDAQSRKKFAEAVGYFDLLYKESQDPIYRDHAMSALMQGHYYNDVIKRLDARKASEKGLSEKDRRYLIVALIHQKSLERAEVEAKTLVKASASEQNYLILAEVYLSQKEYVKALSILEKAYTINYSERVLDQIAVIIYNHLGSPYEAIGRIESHSKNFGYSLPLTQRLVAFYGDQHDEAGLLKSYPHLYKLDPSEKNANILIQLYWNANKILELIAFLEKSHANDELLLKLYVTDKMYDKAIPLADKLYKKSGALDYLGQKAMFMYERAGQNRDQKLIDSVIADLSKVVSVKEEPHYLNYLGYCMIENDRNITQGMAYVERALKIEPDSGYFIDSLAWGYYKQGKCQKAKSLMERVIELLGAEDPEVKAHVKAIKNCLKKEEKR